MTRRCAWCGRHMGQTAPFEDEGITHGICPACARRTLPRLDKTVRRCAMNSGACPRPPDEGEDNGDKGRRS